MSDETVFLQVSLKFSSPSALPGEKTSLNLKASPGSLCSVRAIDQSVLLLRPEAELNAAFVCYIIIVQYTSSIMSMFLISQLKLI